MISNLIQLAHSGGCKLSLSVLHGILARTPVMAAFPDFMVGTKTGDDAAVGRMNDAQALVATTSFFTPIVDDSYD